MNERVLLVIPCFNEANRIQINEFKQAPAFISFLFVDDGSTDDTFDHIQRSIDHRMRVLKLERNGGKAEAVRQGMLYAQERTDVFHFDWIGFWDADLSTPLYEVENFLTYNKTFYRDEPAIFGSRVFRFGGDIQRYAHRHYLGRFFATVVRLLFGIGSYDSQCGAKLFKKELISSCFAESFVSKWIFDVEIILRLKNTGIVEYPLKEWRDISGGKLNVVKAFFTVGTDICRMRTRY